MADDKSNAGFQARILSPASPSEQVQAQISLDRHEGSSEAAVLRLRKEELDARAARLDAIERDSRQQAQAATQALMDQAAAAARQMQELMTAQLAAHEAATKAAIEGIERARKLSEKAAEYQPPPPPAWADVAKHLLDKASGLVEKLIDKDPTVATKAADALSELAQAFKSDSAEPVVSLGLLASARDLLTDDEFAALCAEHECAPEDLPAALLIEAGRKKAATHASA